MTALSFSADGFWQAALAYEPATCVRCERGIATNSQNSCGRCKWELHAEVDEGCRALESYLGNWAAFRDWESS